ncbi:MAG: ATP-dependent DNA helicase RecG [Firmicutes bacterium]|nr:ATP-dependent DNA helicase RecG [Bacillota bacterium]
MDEKLLTLIGRERATGCRDAAVFGGFGSFVAELGDPGLAALGEAYAAAPLDRRPALLDDMERRVRQMLSGEEAADGAAESLFAPAAPAPAPPAPNKKTAAPKASAAKPKLQAPAPQAVSPLELPLTSLRQVGEKRAALFAKLGLHSVGQLLDFLPRAYRDRRQVTPIAQLRLGVPANVCATIRKTTLARTRRGFSLLTCVAEDDSGSISLVWFNQPFLEKKLRPGRELRAWGRSERRWDRLSFLVQEYQLAGENGDWEGLVPVYPLTAGLSNRALQAAVKAAWQRAGAYVRDVVPRELTEQRGLLPRREALRLLHFPEEPEQVDRARRSMAYEELLELSLVMQRSAAPGPELTRRPTDNEELRQRFQNALPFSLTEAQSRVIDEIYADLDRPRPMARLVQGDVGSGKTMVAAAAMLKCCAAGAQAALMAPTEILARQHYQTLGPLFDKLGLTSALLTGATPAGRRKEVLELLYNGELDCVIGTHALIQSGVEFCKLGLAVTDEQHRFGVAQRARLRGGAGVDMLIMTATPIPRTLAMTLYADLDLSLIDQLPPGRKPVKTFAVDYSYEQRVFAFIEKQVAEGGQAFVVCPLIEENDELELGSATAVYERLSREVFPSRRLALLHGRMKPQEKDEVMSAFREGSIDILVSTTVIEVGVDVPNACVMLVLDAERFGLAQLHQLRGRIGRGERQGYCVLLYTPVNELVRERMDIICSTADGYELAEADLRLRGPGEFLGQRQHGLPELQAADIFRDSDLLQQAHSDAARLLAEGPLPEALEKKVQALASLMT